VPVLVWRLAAPVVAVSSAVLGGGVGECLWVINASVPMSYGRSDPATHLREIAAHLGLRGPGVGLMTGVDVGDVISGEDGEVRLWATVGLGAPIQAAAEPEFGESEAAHAGTVNIVAWVPRPLVPGALVNAVATITEAKAQAIRDLGIEATGTATDAICVLCPHEGPQRRSDPGDGEYGGPRSVWGARLARAAYRAVLAGGGRELRSWSDRVSGS
jgi:adenosylcobinamide amidohydrolase